MRNGFAAAAAPILCNKGSAGGAREEECDTERKRQMMQSLVQRSAGLEGVPAVITPQFVHLLWGSNNALLFKLVRDAEAIRNDYDKEEEEEALVVLSSSHLCCSREKGDDGFPESRRYTLESRRGDLQTERVRTLSNTHGTGATCYKAN